MGELRRVAVEAARRHGLGGLALVVVREDQETEFACVGLASAETGRAVTPETVFRIATISKTITAVALMQLWEEGRCSIRPPRPIRSCLP